MGAPRNIRRKEDLDWNERASLQSKINDLVESGNNWEEQEISLFLKKRTTDFSLATNNEKVIAAYQRLIDKLDNRTIKERVSFTDLIIWTNE